MPLTKEQKKEVVAKLKENLEKQKVIFLIDFQNLKAEELFDLRKKLKENDSLLYVAKKNLIKIGFKEKKIPIDVEKLKGQVALVFGFKEGLLPAKTIYKFWEEHKNPEILGGFLENEFVEAEKVIELASLPSREELLARLIISMNSPTYNFVNVLQANIKGLTCVLTNIKAAHSG